MSFGSLSRVIRDALTTGLYDSSTARAFHVLPHRGGCAAESTFAQNRGAVIVVHEALCPRAAQMTYSGFEVVQFVLQMLGQPMVQSITAHFDES